MGIDDCRRIAERLTPYVDGALPHEERAAVERHLGACPPCREMAAGDEAGRTVIRGCAGRLRTAFEQHVALPPGLETRCEALARAHAQPPATRWLSSWAPAGLASLLVLLTATAMLVFATGRSDTLLAAQLAADHMKCFRGFQGQAAVQDARQLEGMMAARYGWDLHMPPSVRDAGLALIGARRCVYAEGRVPHVMYRVHGRDVSLFILKGVSRPDADVTALGHRARIWSRGPNTFVLLASASAGEMADVARYVRKEAH